MNKREIIIDLQSVNKEIRLAARRGISNFERDQHLAEAIKTVNTVIGVIQISETLDAIFDGITKITDSCDKSDFSMSEKPSYQTIICPHCTHVFTADLNDIIVCPECHEQVVFDPQFPEYEEEPQTSVQESLFQEGRQ